MVRPRHHRLYHRRLHLSRALTGSAALGGTLAATTLLMLMHWVLVHAAARSASLSQVLEGRPVGLGESAQIHESGRLRHAVSDADLNEALRTAGVDELSDVKLIVSEPSGKISVLKIVDAARRGQDVHAMAGHLDRRRGRTRHCRGREAEASHEAKEEVRLRLGR